MQLYLKNFKYSIFLSLLLIPLYYFFLYSNMWNIFKAQTIFGDLKLNILWLKCNYEGFKVFEYLITLLSKKYSPVIAKSEKNFLGFSFIDIILFCLFIFATP